MPRSVRARRATPLVVTVALALQACGRSERLDVCVPEEKPVLSILAVGDTGDRPEITELLDQQLEVGRALAAEHRRSPVAAITLLGDNFYSEGLEEHEAAERIRVNVAKTFCPFLASDGPRYAEIADGCALPQEDRTPVPLFPVLGNHDYNTPESPKLQRELVPQYISNWDMPLEVAAVRELGSGVSLILVDSEALSHGADPAILADALRAARGPWRILVTHHPVAERSTKWNDAFEAALVAADVPVQMLLAGHDHNLQISEPGSPFPALVVVSGSGSRVRGPTYGVVGVKFLHVRPGFARIDLVGQGEAQSLVVSLIETPKHALDFWSSTRVVACWSVDEAGEVAGEARISDPVED